MHGWVWVLLWVAWGIIFFAIEVPAVMQGGSGSLSSQVWQWLGRDGTVDIWTWVRRAIFIIFWVWLTLHFFGINVFTWGWVQTILHGREAT